MDRKRIIGEVAARHGLLLEEDDPAFLLVTIAEIALRDAQAELHGLPSNQFTESFVQLGDALREMLDQFRV